MRRAFFTAMLAAACAATSGCYSLSARTESVNPVLINQPKPGGHFFSREERLHYIYLGLFALNPNLVPEMLRSYQVGDIRSVSITTEIDSWGVLATVLTAGFYTNRVVRIEGASD